MNLPGVEKAGAGTSPCSHYHHPTALPPYLPLSSWKLALSIAFYLLLPLRQGMVCMCMQAFLPPPCLFSPFCFFLPLHVACIEKAAVTGGEEVRQWAGIVSLPLPLPLPYLPLPAYPHLAFFFALVLSLFSLLLCPSHPSKSNKIKSNCGSMPCICSPLPNFGQAVVVEG